MQTKALSKSVTQLFIANRGEIARRIALTARRLGIKTVALSDRSVPPRYLSDAVTQIIKVDEETPALYLNPQRMVDLALASGCDALHPGFGFLSESAAFASMVEEAGLTWVGPHPTAIEAMASKASAREWAEKAAVPCVRGLANFPVPQSKSGDFGDLTAFAERTGYPLLIKAAYGGGGKGMRLVTEPKDLIPSALRAHSEALNSFGNGTLICEEYLTSPRHIEVQILGDRHGRVVAIGDRDCSVQRRHQKIIEEAPAPELRPELRQKIHAAAVRLAQAVGYDNAGTVEFLLDWSREGRQRHDPRFFFLEMNTRLQVEHPVTEEVFGLDLVEWQIRVARGEALPAAFEQLTPRGHSVEIRLYAEDTRKDFFPSPGPVALFRPAEGPGIRWELGLDPTDEITGRFDPMIAKLIATGADRTVALSRLSDALARTFFAGPASNLELLHDLTTASPFADGPVTTHFIQEELHQSRERQDQRRALVEAQAQEIFRHLLEKGSRPTSATSGAETTLGVTQRVFQKMEIQREAFGAGSPDGKTPETGAPRSPPFTLSLTEEITPHWNPPLKTQGGSGQWAHPGSLPATFGYAITKSGSTKHLWVAIGGCHFYKSQAKEAAGGVSPSSVDGGRQVIAPVPGKVIAILVAEGQEVAAGDTLLVLESMKMEFEVKASKDGMMEAMTVKTGDQVTAGQTLATFA